MSACGPVSAFFRVQATVLSWCQQLLSQVYGCVVQVCNTEQF